MGSSPTVATMTKWEEYDRQQLSDALIKEMLEEIDRDTIARYNMGQRLLPDPLGGHTWFYITDGNGKVIDSEKLDENGRLK